MTGLDNVYKKTYRDYLARFAQLDLSAVDRRLGVAVEGDEAVVPLFGKPYRVSRSGIVNPEGVTPTLDLCVIVSRYLILSPKTPRQGGEWVNFRDLKDSGPLTTYFRHDVERAIAREFEDQIHRLETAARALGGREPALEISCDLAKQFDALPRVPVLVVFHDGDDEFPAECSVLFESCAEDYLDPECLAMLGRFLFTSLRDASTVGASSKS